MFPTTPYKVKNLYNLIGVHKSVESPGFSEGSIKRGRSMLIWQCYEERAILRLTWHPSTKPKLFWMTAWLYELFSYFKACFFIFFGNYICVFGSKHTETWQYWDKVCWAEEFVGSENYSAFFSSFSCSLWLYHKFK